MRHTMIVVMCLGLSLLATQAQGALYSYDFSAMGYTHEQGLEGMVLDFATFTSETGALEYDATHGGGLRGNVAGTSDIVIAFSEPVYNISVTAGDGGGDDDAFALTLYNESFLPLGPAINSPVFDDGSDPEWYTLNTTVTGVHFMRFDPGNAGVLPGVSTSTGGVVMTDFSYCVDVVPVPSAVLLGALGLGVARWRLRKETTA